LRAAGGLPVCCSPGLGGRRRARASERAAGRLARWRARDSVSLSVWACEGQGLFGPRLKLALVGAAPVDHELLEFFDACGVTVLEDTA